MYPEKPTKKEKHVTPTLSPVVAIFWASHNIHIDLDFPIVVTSFYPSSLSLMSDWKPQRTLAEGKLIAFRFIQLLTRPSQCTSVRTRHTP